MTVDHGTLIIDHDQAQVNAIVAQCPRGARVGDLLRLPELKSSDDTLVLIIGPSVDEAAATDFVARLRAKQPRAAAILVRHRLDTATLMAALRAGVSEVITERDLGDLGAAVERARTQCARVRRADDTTAVSQRARVTTVFAAKGGVGKTTVAINTAAHLAARGDRVCLIDLDVAFGDVAVSLNVFPTRTLADAAARGDSLDVATLEAMLVAHDCGVFILAAPPDPAAADDIAAELITRVVELLSGRFDHVVIDTPPALDDRVLAALDLSDAIVLVATPDVPALKNLRLALETLHLIGIDPARQYVVLNRADADAGIRAADVPIAIGREVLATIPSSRDVPAAANTGVALITQSPGHPVSKAIATLVSQSSEVGVDDVATVRTFARPWPRRRRTPARRIPAVGGAA